MNTLMEMGLSFSEIKELTDDEYIMILATKIAIKDKESEQLKSQTAAAQAPKFRMPTRGLY